MHLPGHGPSMSHGLDYSPSDFVQPLPGSLYNPHSITGSPEYIFFFHLKILSNMMYIKAD